MATKLLRRPKVTDITGDPNSTLYDKIGKGTFVPSVKIGPRSVGWPEDEVYAINDARIAGKTEDEIRALVVKLVAARKAYARRSV